MVVRRPHRLALCGLVALALSGTGLPAMAQSGAAPDVRSVEPAPEVLGLIDDEALMTDVDCDQLTGPAATSTAALTGAPKKIRLDVLVVVDVAGGATIAATRDARQRAAAEKVLYAKFKKRLTVGVESYAPLGITLAYDRFALLQPLVKGKPRVRTDDAEAIIALAKAQYRGVRPPGIDVVYVVTDLNIQMAGVGKGLSGKADCIGGVALPDRAFAVGEDVPGEGGTLPRVPLTLEKDLTAKLAAHEIGHLMGGHHHYQECGTPIPGAIARGDGAVCTIMSNVVTLQTLPFSTLNGIVVRGHAEKFAAANG